MYPGYVPSCAVEVLAVWVVALVLPGYDFGLLLFSGAIIAWARFGLLAEP